MTQLKYGCNSQQPIKDLAISRRRVNEPSLGEPRLSRLDSFIFGPSSSSNRA
jgi:hypothetical protein